MPRIAGLNIVAVFAAAVAMYMVGYLFYGVALLELWQQSFLSNHGVQSPDGVPLTGEALAAAVAAVPGQMPFWPSLAAGFLISIVQALGVSLVLHLARPTTLVSALRTISIAWAGFVVTTLAYNVIYYGESRTAFAIDLAHTFVAFLVGATVLFFLDRAGAKPST